MEYLKHLKYDRLYTVWAVLFAATALLGLCFPDPAGFGRFLLLMLTVSFFVPPWLILLKSRAENSRRNRMIVFWLSLASLGATLLLFCAGILSLRLGEGFGRFIHILMTVLCAPLTCGNYYALPLFLWATLLWDSLRRRK